MITLTLVLGARKRGTGRIQVFECRANLWCQPKYVVEVGDPAEEILKVAKRHKADLIVMGVKRIEGDLGASTHLPWAIAHKIISQACCPVLTVVG